MEIVLKYAASLDGYLNDNSSKRYVFSSQADQEATDQLRAEADAILIGAGTLREDNPSLKVKNEVNKNNRKAKHLSDQPLRICLSKSGNFNPELQFFDESAKSFVISPVINKDLKSFHLDSKENADVSNIISIIESLGVKKLLVEGGAEIHQLFLNANIPLKLRICLKGVFLGSRGTSQLNFPENIKLELLDQHRLGDNIILWFSK